LTSKPSSCSNSPSSKHKGKNFRTKKKKALVTFEDLKDDPKKVQQKNQSSD